MYRHTWTKNTLALHHLNAVLQALQAIDINTCLLKGAALLTTHYQDVGLRFMSDIDLLVPKNKALSAMRLLEQLGWRPEEKISANVLHPNSLRCDGYKFKIEVYRSSWAHFKSLISHLHWRAV